MKWTAREIARNLYWHVFNAKHLVVVPNCCWPGAECDMLVVRNDLRLMDVEIKISRADLRADKHKEKWRKPWDYQTHGWYRTKPEDREPVEHPQNIWKHYYVLPQEIWTDDLVTDIQPKSGIILIRDAGTWPSLRIKRQAKPNKDAPKISPADLLEIARSQAARMWKAYGEIDEHRRETERASAA